MGTATSRSAAAGLAALALALTGCGSATHSSSDAAKAAPFGWLRPASPPAGWSAVRIPGGAVMSYPPGWVRIGGDPGTASAASFDSAHHFVGYLNITPRQSRETLGDWAHFRVAHNAEENDRNITTLAVGTGLRFRAGRGSCVRDSYTTAAGASYIEVACLVAGPRSSVVIVGASPPKNWARTAPLLERAISSMLA